MTAIERITKIKNEIRIDPKLCIERARLYTASYKSTEGQEPVIRRAKAVAEVLEEKAVIINDGELIVGNPTSKRIAAPVLPEIAWEWYTKMMFGAPSDDEDEGEGVLDEDEKKGFLEIDEYLKGRSLRDMWMAELPQEYTELEYLSWMQGSGNPSAGYYFAHCVPDFERILYKGISGMIAEVDAEMAKLDVTKLSDLHKKTYLKAIRITLEAVVVWAKRLSVKAAEMASAETDPERKAELEKIAYICNKVPEKPAETFYEAMQSVWISYVAVMVEGWGPGIGFGRMD
ncbi:MAG: hypothetical protein GX847_11575, partial [Clostridiales bacterium]|nr:hypothetical protein [Clostridiales bacterium]